MSLTRGFISYHTLRMHVEHLLVNHLKFHQYNYFISCVVVDAKEAHEVAQVLAEIRMLKEQAASYLCAEENLKLKSFGACYYFDRASAPEVVTKEEVDTQVEVLSDVTRMKKIAADFY